MGWVRACANRRDASQLEVTISMQMLYVGLSALGCHVAAPHGAGCLVLLAFFVSVCRLVGVWFRVQLRGTRRRRVFSDWFRIGSVERPVVDVRLRHNLLFDVLRIFSGPVAMLSAPPFAFPAPLHNWARCRKARDSCASGFRTFRSHDALRCSSACALVVGSWPSPAVQPRSLEGLFQPPWMQALSGVSDNCAYRRWSLVA